MMVLTDLQLIWQLQEEDLTVQEHQEILILLFPNLVADYCVTVKYSRDIWNQSLLCNQKVVVYSSGHKRAD